MSKPPSRRTVMKSFGLYIDYTVWFGRVKAGLEEPPEGDDISDMARSVANCEAAYREELDAYIRNKTQE